MSNELSLDEIRKMTAASSASIIRPALVATLVSLAVQAPSLLKISSEEPQLSALVVDGGIPAATLEINAPGWVLQAGSSTSTKMDLTGTVVIRYVGTGGSGGSNTGGTSGSGGRSNTGGTSGTGGVHAIDGGTVKQRG